MTKETEHPTRLLTVNQFVEAHPFTTHGGLRHIIFNAETNGFKKVIKRMGRKVLIDEKIFFQWVNEQNEARHA